jgi:hypothetical protein
MSSDEAAVAVANEATQVASANGAKREEASVPVKDDQAPSLGSGKKRKAAEMDDGAEKVEHVSTSLDTVVLKVGQRIEVQWDVTMEDGTNEARIRPVWWGATYNGFVTPTKHINGQPVSTIQYDKMEHFEACKCECVFVNKRVCFDVAELDNLFWRIQGDPWSPPVGIPVEQYGCFGAGEVTMTAAELLKDQKKMDNTEHLGVPLEALGMAAMAQMPQQQQMQMATAYRSFADKLQSELKSLVQLKGSGYTVTERDMKEILHKIS